MNNRSERPRYWQDIPAFRDVTEEQWNSWGWQVKNTLTTVEQLQQVVRLTASEKEGLLGTRTSFRTGLSPYWAALMDPENPDCPIRLQAIPRASETWKNPSEMRDPLGEDADMVVPGLVHRYPDRVLLLVNNMCSMYCRYCTRKRTTSEDNTSLGTAEFEAVFDYLRSHPKVRDILISGGDPFMMSDKKIGSLLRSLREIPSLEVIRFGSRLPVVLPQRITPELVETLRAFHPIWVNTHFNHPKELTRESRAACARMIDAGIPVGNQSVLLRRVNSSVRTLKHLFQQLVAARIRPYYLYQCDLVEGASDFRTPVAKGIQIMEELRGHTSGYAVPTYVIDAPGGGGKVPVAPQYLLSSTDQEVVVRNYEWDTFRYQEPTERDCSCPYEDVFFETPSEPRESFMRTHLTVVGSPARGAAVD
jgi:lysine 2,3-aminomutase